MPEESGKDIFQGMPWYIKAIALVGIPSLISLALVWTNEARIVGTVTENQKILYRAERKVEEQRETLKDNFSAIDRQNRTNERLLRLICAGVHKTEESKQTCWKEQF